MSRRKNDLHVVQELEEQLGILLECALDLAVSRPPERQEARLKHLAEIRDAAAAAATLANAAVVLLKQRANRSNARRLARM